MIGHELGHYRILEKLGEGGMGEVYLAEDTELDRQVALKLLRPEMADAPERLERFRCEAKAAAALNHPSIVTIYSIEEADGQPFLTMELVDGKTLDHHIPEGGITKDRFLNLAVPLADALGIAHTKGIVHRDLKPANIMVTDEGQVKILDFGLAKLRGTTSVEADSELETLGFSQEGLLMGTVPYMSPEQVQGKEVDYRSDIFSLGVVLYEMATGKRPFEGENSARLISSILRDEPRPVAEINHEASHRLSRAIRRCIEKDAERRFQSAIDLRNELEELSGDETPHAPSLAVLPFADMSPNKDQDYFCEGIAEELINAFAKIEGLRVASRVSSFRFAGLTVELGEIGRMLNVDTVLDGSVRKSGNKLRITAELVNPADGYSLWTGRWDREISDVFAIQDEIADHIVRALEVRLAPRERRAIRMVSTADPQAYDYYLHGRKFYYQYRRQGAEFALQMFSRAIDIDPQYALAWAGMSDCHVYLCANAGHNEEDLRRADVASRNAIELDPELAEAQASRGATLSLLGRHPEAEAAFEAAIRLNSRLFEAHYFFARDCFAQGHFEKAIGLYERASELRPDDYLSPLLMAQIYDDLGCKEDATACRRRGIGRAEEHLKLHPDDIRAVYMGGNGLVALGDHERGLEWARKALEMEPEEGMVLYNVACIFSLAGRLEDAIDCLEKSTGAGLVFLDWIRHDSNLDPLRDNLRFQKLIERLEEIQVPCS